MPRVHPGVVPAAAPSWPGVVLSSTLEDSKWPEDITALPGVQPGVALAPTPACTGKLVAGKFKRDYGSGNIG
jgi:hypothetical protein